MSILRIEYTTKTIIISNCKISVIITGLTRWGKFPNHLGCFDIPKLIHFLENYDKDCIVKHHSGDNPILCLTW